MQRMSDICGASLIFFRSRHRWISQYVYLLFPFAILRWRWISDDIMIYDKVLQVRRLFKHLKQWMIMIDINYILKTAIIFSRANNNWSFCNTNNVNDVNVAGIFLVLAITCMSRDLNDTTPMSLHFCWSAHTCTHVSGWSPQQGRMHNCLNSFKEKRYLLKKLNSVFQLLKNLNQTCFLFVCLFLFPFLFYKL